MFRNVNEIRDNKFEEALKAFEEEHREIVFDLVRQYVKSRWPRWLMWLPVIFWRHYIPLYTTSGMQILWKVFPGGEFAVRWSQNEKGAWRNLEIQEWMHDSDIDELKELRKLLWDHGIPVSVYYHHKEI